jgi:hypothetical protein
MTSNFKAPLVSGVTDGQLNLDVTKLPVVAIDYTAINEPHTISVLWEIMGPVNVWVWCSELLKQPAGACSATVTPEQSYSNLKSVKNRVRVRYSISVNEAEPVLSEPLMFNAIGSGSTDGYNYRDMGFRDTRAQRYDGVSGTIVLVEVATEELGDFAYVYAAWSDMKTHKKSLNFIDEHDNQVWQSAYGTSDSEMTIFKVPKSTLLPYRGGKLYSTLVSPPEEHISAGRTITLSLV